jgi:tetratricopeptide (TPR) repeat protein
MDKLHLTSITKLTLLFTRNDLRNMHLKLALLVVACSLTPQLAFGQDVDNVESALARQRAGDKAAALTEFAKAIQTNPKDSIAYIDRAILRFGTGDHKGGFEDINLALKINMIDFNALRTRADFKAETGDTKGALRDYAEAIKWNSNDTAAYTNRGITLIKQGDKKGALDDFKKAIALHSAKAPEPETYFAIATVHYYLGDKDEALGLFTKAITLNPSYAHALFNRAVVCEELGQQKICQEDRVKNAQLSLADYDKCLELDSLNARAYYNRSLLKELLHDREGSMNDLKRAIEIDPQLKTGEGRSAPFELMLS